MKQCSHYRTIHGVNFKCRNVASLEVCYNKETASYEPYCTECFRDNYSELELKHWLVREIS